MRAANPRLDASSRATWCVRGRCRVAASLLTLAVACDAAPRGGSPVASAGDAASADPGPDPDVALGGGAAAGTARAARFPGLEWPRGSPEDVGLDPEALDRAAAYADAIGSRCLVIVREGAIVYERTFGDARPEQAFPSWSIAKSVTSALIGVAIRRGEIGSEEDLVSEYLPEWGGTPREAIRIRHLLAMSSGLATDLVSDNFWVVTNLDQTSSAVETEVAVPPDAEWRYSSRSVQVLAAVLQRATGLDPEDYARRHLFGPIGMRIDGAEDERVSWNREPGGDPTLYASVRASCRDLARFGYLVLHRGWWDGAPVIDEAYLARSLRPSQPLNPAYGYFWWLNGQPRGLTHAGRPYAGSMIPEAPADLVSAQGLGQNFVDVVRSTRTVFVHERPAALEPPTRVLSDPLGTVTALAREGENPEHRQLWGQAMGI